MKLIFLAVFTLSVLWSRPADSACPVLRAGSLDATFCQGRTNFAAGGRRFSLQLAGRGVVTAVHVDGQGITYYRDGIAEWFVAQAQGFEQGFTVYHRPATSGLELAIAVSGDFTPAAMGDDILLADPANGTLRYGGLAAWDVRGRRLPAHASVAGNTIRLRVDDAGAQYPVTIDPTLQPIVINGSGTAFGQTVAIDGNIIAVANQGAVYLYFKTGATLTLQGSFMGSTPGYGTSLSLSADSASAGVEDLWVGAPDEGSGGVVHLFKRALGTWSETLQFASPSMSPGYGQTVASGPYGLFIGCPKCGANGQLTTFSRDDNTWSGSAIANADGLGQAIAMSGASAVVSQADGAPYVELFTYSGSRWTDAGPIDASGVSAGQNYGNSIALSGNILAVGESQATTPRGRSTGAVYVFDLSQSPVTQIQIAASDGEDGDLFGSSVAVDANGNVLVGASGASGGAGAAYYFLASTGWQQAGEIAGSSGQALGTSAASSFPTMVLGAPGTDQVQLYPVPNIDLISNPTGRSFTLTSNSGCWQTGTYVTPLTTNLTDCTVTWTSPDTSTPETQYTFEQWFDGVTTNAREITLAQNAAPTIYSADFTTQYQLTAQAAPVSGGTVSGSGYYSSGMNAIVTATPNPGFIFTGYTSTLLNGVVAGTPGQETFPVNGPVTITADFSPTPNAALTASVTAKSGASNSRVWNLALTDSGPGVAFDIYITGVMLTQTFGTACAPVRLIPTQYPLLLTSLSMGVAAQTSATFDFSSCAANARFTATIGYLANGGSSVGSVQLVNQFQ